MNNENIIGGRITKWLIVGPPLLFLLVFFVAPSLIMFVTSLRFPGEFGGLAPLVAPAGETDGGYGLTLEAYRFLLSNSQWLIRLHC
jgi:spermidine/putrescine transport system permease protein